MDDDSAVCRETGGESPRPTHPDEELHQRLLARRSNAAEVMLLSFALKWVLRFTAALTRALGRRLPGPLPVAIWPEIDPNDLPEEGDIYAVGIVGCTAWRKGYKST
jgi:hypothetical protein